MSITTTTLEPTYPWDYDLDNDIDDLDDYNDDYEDDDLAGKETYIRQCFAFTLLFYQIEPLKNGAYLIFPSSIARNS